MNPFRIYGHRGSPRTHPENTVESFEETLRSGADGFETDLRLLSDRTALLFHDDSWQEVAIESLTSLEFTQRGGTLTRLSDLARFAGRTTMILEVKRSRWEDLLLSEIGTWTGIVVASFDHHTIVELTSRGVPFDVGLTIYGRIVDVAKYAENLGATWVFPSHHYVDEDLVISLHERKIQVVPWTVNTVGEWRRLRDIGCDGVITDDPAGAVRWRSMSSGPAI